MEVIKSADIVKVTRQQHLEFYSQHIKDLYRQKASIIERFDIINQSLCVEDDVYADSVWEDIRNIGGELGELQDDISETRERIRDLGQNPDHLKICVDGHFISEPIRKR